MKFSGVDFDPVLEGIDEEKQLKAFQMTQWLADSDHVQEITCDWLGEKGICPDELYSKKLSNKYVRSLFVNIYYCNEEEIWDFFSENYDNYIRS